jgi:type I restriction enzyme S subunit
MFYYGFKAGQFLLVSRNPHLKKAGIVDFDGICSEKTFVLQTANPLVLLPEYLPFVLQNEAFWKYAVAHKHGSTNFFINWDTLANYEFLLPSIDTQRRIAKNAWAAYRVKKSYETLLESIDNLVKSQFIEMFDNGDYPIVKAQEVCDFITKGTTPQTSEITQMPEKDSVPYIKVYNLSFNGDLLFDEEPQYISRNIHSGKLARSIVYPGDVLMNIVGPPLGKFALVTDEYSEWNINQAIAFFRAKDKILPKFLLYALMQPKVLDPFLKQAVGIRQLNLSLEQCRNLEFSLPPIDKQIEFIGFAEQSDKSKSFEEVAA